MMLKTVREGWGVELAVQIGVREKDGIIITITITITIT